MLHVAELARQYEASGGISFRGFIDELRTAAASEAAEAPILEEGSDGVRLMTVHKAKGLEFPVVILADLTCNMSRKDASRYLDASRGLCAMKIGGWAPHELHRHEADGSGARPGGGRAPGLRRRDARARSARRSRRSATTRGTAAGSPAEPRALSAGRVAAKRRRAAPGCPAFKSKDSVLQRPNDEPAGNGTVCPGLHAFDGGPGAPKRGEGGYSVVWWDPGALKLDEKPTFGVRREDLIVKDVPKNVIADGRSRYDRWHLARDDAREAGAVPSLMVEPARDWVAANSEFGIQNSEFVTVVGAGRSGEEARSGGIGFGLLVHGLLAKAPFGAAARSARRPRRGRGARARAQRRGGGGRRGGRRAAADARRARARARRRRARRVPARDAGHLHDAGRHA